MLVKRRTITLFRTSVFRAVTFLQEGPGIRNLHSLTPTYTHQGRYSLSTIDSHYGTRRCVNQAVIPSHQIGETIRDELVLQSLLFLARYQTLRNQRQEESNAAHNSLIVDSINHDERTPRA